MLLVPLFKLTSPTEGEWTALALICTGFLFACIFTVLMIIKDMLFLLRKKILKIKEFTESDHFNIKIMKENTEFPLYPELTEAGKEETQKLIDSFKENLKKVAEETIDELYGDAALYIESDSWGNFRNDIMDGFKNYDNRLIQNEYDFKTIREEIYKEYREEIIKDLNQDLLTENEKLKEENGRLYDRIHKREF